jgi:hypothetical protein
MDSLDDAAVAEPGGLQCWMVSDGHTLIQQPGSGLQGGLPVPVLCLSQPIWHLVMNTSLSRWLLLLPRVLTHPHCGQRIG